MKITDKYVFFWNGIYSNWFPCKINIRNREFNCTEQHMMYMKACLFSDYEIADQIMLATSPKVQKALGRQIKNFDPIIWEENCQEFVYEGNLAKFQQNVWLKNHILHHGKGRKFVEASPLDRIWGIGLHENTENIEDPTTWKGSNYLGKVLDRVYKRMMEDENANCF